MGGEILLESTPGVGSTFAFTLAFPALDEGPLQGRTVPPDLRGFRILVVDDQAVVREACVHQLQAMGFEARAADSGPQALDMLTAGADEAPFRLVLLDWQMPGMDGFEVARRIRSHPSLSALPTIIMVSAFGREEVRRQAHKEGIEAFLIKPVNPSLLLNTILETLGHEGGPSHPLQPPEPSVQGSVLKGVRVLVAEDNVINQEVAQGILEHAGLRVDIAGSGQEAIRMVDTQRYDAVLMDIQMPDMDGYAATERIREKSIHSQLPIIAMTAHATAEDREACLASGMNDFVSKPIEPEKLLRVLASWVKGRTETPPVDLPREVPDPGEAEAQEGPFQVRRGILRMAGNRPLYMRLLRTFVETEGETWARIQALRSSQDVETLERTVHALKGVAGNLAARRLFDLAQVLESQLRAQQVPEEASWQALRAELESALAAAQTLAETPNDPVEEPSSPLVETRAEELLAVLQDLSEHLRKRDPRSSSRLSDLRARCPEAHRPGLDAVEQHLAGYGFKQAAQALGAWATEHGYVLEAPAHPKATSKEHP